MAKLRLASILALCLAYPFPTHAESPKQVFPPLEQRTARQYQTCPGGPSPRASVKAIDLSQPVDDVLLKKAWDNGVRVIFRYYDWKDVPNKLGDQCQLGRHTKFNRQFDLPWKSGPTFRGKTLTAAERDRIQSKGFSLGIVFQHCHGETFKDRKRAIFDANRALELAQILSQPKDTTIFFGADFNATEKDIKNIKKYFRVVSAALRPHGYRVGVYGNGYVCQALKDDHLASYCWLSQSIGFLGSESYHRSGAWDIKQCATREPYGKSSIDFDADIINPTVKSIGLWKPM